MQIETITPPGNKVRVVFIYVHNAVFLRARGKWVIQCQVIQELMMLFNSRCLHVDLLAQQWSIHCPCNGSNKIVPFIYFVRKTTAQSLRRWHLLNTFPISGLDRFNCESITASQILWLSVYTTRSLQNHFTSMRSAVGSRDIWTTAICYPSNTGTWKNWHPVHCVTLSQYRSRSGIHFNKDTVLEWSNISGERGFILGLFSLKMSPDLKGHLSMFLRDTGDYYWGGSSGI